MKLRFEDQSLRLRLSAAEVAQFAETGRVAVVVPLGHTAQENLTYALERTEAEEFHITHHAGAITVQVPAALAQRWTSTDQNGLSTTLLMLNQQPLQLLIEKDLACRH